MMNDDQQKPGRERTAERSQSEVKLEATVLAKSLALFVYPQVVDSFVAGPW